MEILPKQTSLFGEEELMSFLVDFPASHFPKQEKDLERMITATSSQKCLEQFEKFNRPGLWAKTFAELLIGTKGWYSKRCRLTWKLKDTKYNRLYFQLQVSERPTKDTEFGLLLTPTVLMIDEKPQKIRDRALKNGYQNGTKFNSLLSQVKYSGILPTPQTAQGGMVKDVKLSEKGNFYRLNKKGQTFGVRLQDVIASGFLPTPTASGKESYQTRSKRQGHKKAMTYLEANLEYQLKMLPTPVATDWKAAGSIEYVLNRHTPNLRDLAPHKMLPTPQASEGTKITGLENQDSLTKRARQESGKTSQLNPRFVAEMMGFPPNWTELPFLSGATPH
jgi:hypothetical protein